MPKSKEISDYLKDKITHPVFVKLFIHDYSDCDSELPVDSCFCAEAANVLEELKLLEKNLILETYVMGVDAAKFETYQIRHVPCIVLESTCDFGMRFYGMPAGYDLILLLDTIIDLGRHQTQLSTQTLAALEGFQKEVAIKIFISPTCLFCPITAHLIHQFAMAVPCITVENIDAWLHKDIARDYNAFRLPTVIINEELAFIGAVSEEELLEYLLRLS